MIEVRCDRCGAKIPTSGKIGYMAWNFRLGLGGDLADGNVLEDKHYCQACMDDIMACIRTAPVPSGGDVRNPGQKKEKKRIDAGKVRALADAGRSARWIADDMGISLQSVYNVLQKRKEAGGGQ